MFAIKNVCKPRKTRFEHANAFLLLRIRFSEWKSKSIQMRRFSCVRFPGFRRSRIWMGINGEFGSISVIEPCFVRFILRFSTATGRISYGAVSLIHSSIGSCASAVSFPLPPYQNSFNKSAVWTQCFFSEIRWEHQRVSTQWLKEVNANDVQTLAASLSRGALLHSVFFLFENFWMTRWCKSSLLEQQEAHVLLRISWKIISFIHSEWSNIDASHMSCIWSTLWCVVGIRG